MGGKFKIILPCAANEQFRHVHAEKSEDSGKKSQDKWGNPNSKYCDFDQDRNNKASKEEVDCRNDGAVDGRTVAKFVLDITKTDQHGCGE